MANFSVKQITSKDGGVQLSVNGSLTIENAAEMRESLMAAFATGDTVMVDLTSVVAIDTSGLQLLCAAHRSSIGLDKRLAVMGSVQPEVRRAAEIAGYYRHIGCSEDVTKTCVWIGGE